MPHQAQPKEPSAAAVQQQNNIIQNKNLAQ